MFRLYLFKPSSLSLSNGATARGRPRPPSRVSSVLPGLGRPFSNFYTLASLHLPPLHLPNAAWVSLWGAFLLAHWGGLSWINHRRPSVWHVLPYDMSCRMTCPAVWHVLPYDMSCPMTCPALWHVLPYDMSCPMTCPARLSLLSLQNFTMSSSPHSW
jgi:hypothetical protein